MNTELHPSIVALVSLAANIAANHPKQGRCQMDKLQQYGVAQEQIDTVIEIARHIRDEAAQSLDASFDLARSKAAANSLLGTIGAAEDVCCTPTPGGKSCC